MKQTFLHIILISFVLAGCSAVKETSKHQMETGNYQVSNQQNRRFFTVVDEDKIILYPVSKTKYGWVTDTLNPSSILLTDAIYKNNETIFFKTSSFDLDVLTILFKYRPYISGFPNQLNTNFNAAGYIGHRADIFRLSYEKDPLNTYKRRMSHFAYSLGFFGGLGATTMNPFVTNNQVAIEYDGVVITKGIVGIVGVGNLTFGLAIGQDNLMDKNHKFWIYQSKLWTGFTIGLNIN